MYINGMATVCAQDCFEGPLQLEYPVLDAEFRMPLKHPDYKQYIAPNPLRRMSPLLKMGLVTALKCMERSSVAAVDGIITGTGKGSLHDTEKFMNDLKTYQETALNPTPFIQSTYNALSGLLALHLNCEKYNNTFVHKGHSLELAMLDAYLQMGSGKGKHYLVGGIEEMTDEHYFIKSRSHSWKKETLTADTLLNSATPGTLSGQGASFLVLSSESSEVQISALKLKQNIQKKDVLEAIQELLTEADLDASALDQVLLGKNGDQRYDGIYDDVLDALEAHHKVFYYKPYVGEYETSIGFALYWAHDKIMRKEFKKILIYTHTQMEQHSFLLLERS
jgi:3-oxoacyl-(acyl-carrier-protein) synthase